MTDTVLFAWTVLVALILLWAPAWPALRLLRLPRPVALAAAPAASGLLIAGSAVVASLAGARFSLLWPIGAAALAAAVAWAARRLGGDLAPLDVPSPVMTLRQAAVVAGFAVVATVPAMLGTGSPAVVLQRWDMLYHLNAVARVMDTGDGSSLTLGALSNTAGDPAFYPAGVHDVAALVPGVEPVIALNGVTFAGSTVPWIVGAAVLVRMLWPRLTWGPTVGAVVAAVVPAAPLTLWYTYAAAPNSVAFAVMPGVAAVAVRAVQQLAARELTVPRVVSALGLGAVVAAGISLFHPNALLATLSLVGVFAVAVAVREVPVLRRAGHPGTAGAVAAVPVLMLLPMIVVSLSQAGQMTAEYGGGIEVPLWRAVGEALTGLVAIWPMYLGVLLTVAAIVGLVSCLGSGPRWPAIWALLVVVLYIDAAAKLPLGLSALFYRSQFRLAVVYALALVILVPIGLEYLRRRLGRPTRAQLAVAVALAVVAVAGTVPTRYANAQLNADPERSDRARFLTPDELEGFAEVVPTLDPDGVVLASPFSGAAHLYGLYGQPVEFPVAGMNLTTSDRYLVQGIEDYLTEWGICSELQQRGIQYVYLEDYPYQTTPPFGALDREDLPGASVLFETDHSALVELADCSRSEGGYTASENPG